MPEYTISFRLAIEATLEDAEEWAAELAADGREHLLAGERIELAGVTAEPTATVPSACRV